MLEISNLHASVGQQRDPAGARPHRERRRGARDHGAQRLRQEHAGPRPGGAPRLRRDRGRGPLQGPGPARHEPEERAREGVFLAFQYPVEIPGVSNVYFLKAALNAIRKHRGLPELDAIDFLALVKEKAKLVDIDEALVKRPVNEGFSRRREEAQRDLPDGDPRPDAGHPRRDRLRPRHRRAAHRGRRASTSCAARSARWSLVTHYQRLLNYIVPDFVHVLLDGRIVQSGGKELALELEKKGYEWLEQAPAAASDERGAGAALSADETRALPRGVRALAASRSARAGLARALRRDGAASASRSSASRPRATRTGGTRASRRSRARRSVRPPPSAAWPSARRGRWRRLRPGASSGASSSS